MQLGIHMNTHYQKILLLALIILFINTLVSCTNSKGVRNLQNGNLTAKHQWLAAEKIEIPFYWHDGHIIIKLTINERKDLLFALDSGASATVLFETNRSKNLQLNKERSLNLQGKEVNVINDVSITIEQLTIDKLTIIQVPIGQSPLFSNYDEAYFDGAIGYDLLKHYRTRIDYENLTVTLFSTDTYEHTDDWLSLPMDINRRIPYITAELTDEDSRSINHDFIIDTGAPDYLYINSKLIDDFKFPKNTYQTNVSNFDGDYVLQTSKVTNFKISNISFPDITTHNSPVFEDDFGVGLIGSGLLKQFTVEFDYSNQRLMLKPNTNLDTNSMMDRSGINLEPHSRGGVVKSISKNSIAKKMGLDKGNIITKINNQKLMKENFDELRNFLSSKLQKVNLCWENTMGSFCKDLILADRI